jgi:hypothetical protein
MLNRRKVVAVDKELNRTEQGVINHLDKAIRKDEQLRELLSYCRTASGGPPFEGPKEDVDRAYNDVANKLAAILDGEQ